MKEYNVDISRLFAYMTSVKSRSVTDKDEELLTEYLKRLGPVEYQDFVRNVFELIDRKTRGNRRAKITHNAVRLVLRVEEYDKNIKLFPFIEKLATKSWGTNDGTYSFSMPILSKSESSLSNGLSGEAFSFGPIDKLISKKNEIDVYTLRGDMVIDFK